MVERRLAFGTTILRIITPNAGPAITAHLRENGQPVTVFQGEGMHGAVNELNIACRRRDLKWILPGVRCIDPKVFYVIEQARDMSKVYRPICSSLGGWQAISNPLAYAAALSDWLILKSVLGITAGEVRSGFDEVHLYSEKTESK